VEEDARLNAATPFKVLVTTSGIGSRLGNFTEHTNKSLVKVGDKLAISHIIENYPLEAVFVVTLGHFGDHVRDFLQVTYPDREFNFVEVETYQGEGSSLGLSMLMASKFLQEPFIFHASDTLIFGSDVVQLGNYNWVAGSKGNSAAQYASFDVSSNNVVRFHRKGMMEFDYLHIGLVGIHDYELFWDTLSRLFEEDPADSTLNDLSAITKMQNQGATFKFLEVSNWYDMGNTESLALARRFKGAEFDVLEKPDESISFTQGSVIKFFGDKQVAINRVERASSLSNLVPKVIQNQGNFFRYEFVEGLLASSHATPERIQDLLEWAERELWISKNEIEPNHFKDLCKKFYKEKTINRINLFFEKTKHNETEYSINGLDIPNVFALLDRINFDWLANGVQSQFHGDFILDNIIETVDGFSLIDWRQDFAGEISAGDMYYDLAKLNHSLVLSHELINLNHFEIDIKEGEIYCDILRKNELVEASNVFQKYLVKKNLDSKKVNILTSLIWLNMAPLHHHPFDLFLFNFGKLNLWRALND
jgi:choline kinase